MSRVSTTSIRESQIKSLPYHDKDTDMVKTDKSILKIKMKPYFTINVIARIKQVLR